jgi:putative intracellular protease/amidase
MALEGVEGGRSWAPPRGDRLAPEDSFEHQVMPWHIEDAAKERGTNYIQAGRFKAFAVRDGRLITGQQQYSGAEVARLVIEAVGT